MIPQVFMPYMDAAYPCFLLDKEGSLFMNDAARQAGAPLNDAQMVKRLLAPAALQAGQGGHISATALPLMTDALTMRLLTLMPVPEGLLAVAIDEYDAPVYAFSSQMREYLTNIFAVLPLLAKHLDDVDLRYVEEVQRNSYSLLRMAGNLENAGQLEQHRIDKRPVDFSALVDALCYCADSVADGHGVPISWSLPPQPVIVNADARLLSEAFLNLLRNSLQYTRDGNQITVRLRVVGGQAVLTVEDKGLGIRPEYLEQVFQPYFSMDPYGDSGVRPGLGLGLSVAHEAATEFGGTVKAESRFGEGTCIHMALPLATGDGEAVLGSDPTDYLLNRYSPVYVQLSGFARLPGL